MCQQCVTTEAKSPDKIPSHKLLRELYNSYVGNCDSSFARESWTERLVRDFKSAVSPQKALRYYTMRNKEAAARAKCQVALNLKRAQILFKKHNPYLMQKVTETFAKIKNRNTGMQAIVDLDVYLQTQKAYSKLVDSRHLWKNTRVIDILQAYVIEGNAHSQVSWQKEPWYQDSPYSNTHLLHPSAINQSLVAFLPDITKINKEIAPSLGHIDPVYTRLSPGKYLTRFFSEQLTQADIKHWANKQIGSMQIQMNILDNDDYPGTERELQDEWFRIYKKTLVDYSCMRGSDGVRAYGRKGNHLGLAYLSDVNGTLAVRTILHKSSHSLEAKLDRFLRAFPYAGSDAAIHLSLEQATEYFESQGFTRSDGLEGFTLAKIKAEDSGSYLCPYIDGDDQEIDIYDDYIKITDSGEYIATNTDGSYGEREDEDEGRDTCSDCEDSYYTEDMYYIGDTYVCRYCVANSYVFSQALHEYIHRDIAILCETDNDYYPEDDLVYYDVYLCEETNLYYKIDDLTQTPDGLFFNDLCVSIDATEDGYDYAYEKYTIVIENETTGETRTYHTASVDAIQEWQDQCLLDKQEASSELDNITHKPLQKAA
jgi:hypothetical protein